VVIVLPWFFNGSSEGCRSYLLTSNFARGEDMMIGNEGTEGTRLYCRWCAVGLCYKEADRRCSGWQAMKPWRRHSLGLRP